VSPYGVAFVLAAFVVLAVLESHRVGRTPEWREFEMCRARELRKLRLRRPVSTVFVTITANTRAFCEAMARAAEWTRKFGEAWGRSVERTPNP
jgi:hypothetical protein